MRCCTSRAAPPASKKPLLAGSANNNSLATSIWNVGNPGKPSPAAITLPPRSRGRGSTSRPSPSPAAMIYHRLIHHAEVISVKEDAYRLKNRR